MPIVLSVIKETSIQGMVRKHLEAKLQVTWAEEKGPLAGPLLGLLPLKVNSLNSWEGGWWKCTYPTERS